MAVQQGCSGCRALAYFFQYGEGLNDASTLLVKGAAWRTGMGG